MEISAARNFPMFGKRFMQRLRYRKLDNFDAEGGDKSFDEFDVKRKKKRVVSLGGYKGKLVWKFKFLPKMKLRASSSPIKKNSPKSSWLAKIGKVNTMSNLLQPFILRKTRTKQTGEDFNDKVIVNFYKSMGVQLQRMA